MLPREDNVLNKFRVFRWGKTVPVTWSDVKLILLLLPRPGSNSQPPAHRSVNMIKVSYALTTRPRACVCAYHFKNHAWCFVIIYCVTDKWYNFISCWHTNWAPESCQVNFIIIVFQRRHFDFAAALLGLQFLTLWRENETVDGASVASMSDLNGQRSRRSSMPCELRTQTDSLDRYGGKLQLYLVRRVGDCRRRAFVATWRRWWQQAGSILPVAVRLSRSRGQSSRQLFAPKPLVRARLAGCPHRHVVSMMMMMLQFRVVDYFGVHWIVVWFFWVLTRFLVSFWYTVTWGKAPPGQSAPPI